MHKQDLGKRWIAVLPAILFLFSSHPAPAARNLVIFHAGSLSIPFKEMSEAFERRYPGVRVVREAAGSRTCARKVTDLGRRCDVLASADVSVIEKLLMPQYASWCISFATNEMAIMYRPDSPYAGEIHARNWFKVLLRKGIRYGHSDPNTDPCGYRTLLVWQLAEKYYGVPGLYRRLQDGCPPQNIRPKETDLIALLEAGELDYLFIYKSVCMQHHMPYVSLPPMINLGSARYRDFYRRARVKITGKRPGTHFVKRGQPMVYGLTVPDNAPHPQLAAQFVAFVIGPEGRKIMERNGQTPIDPPRVSGIREFLPKILRACIP